MGFSRGFGRLRPLTPSAGLGSSVCKGWTLFLKCAEDGYHAFIRAQIRSRLKPIKGTDWTRPFSYFYGYNFATKVIAPHLDVEVNKAGYLSRGAFAATFLARG